MEVVSSVFLLDESGLDVAIELVTVRGEVLSFGSFCGGRTSLFCLGGLDRLFPPRPMEHISQVAI